MTLTNWDRQKVVIDMMNKGLIKTQDVLDAMRTNDGEVYINYEELREKYPECKIVLYREIDYNAIERAQRQRRKPLAYNDNHWVVEGLSQQELCAIDAANFETFGYKEAYYQPAPNAADVDYRLEHNESPLFTIVVNDANGDPEFYQYEDLPD